MVASKKLHLVSCAILCLFAFLAIGSLEWEFVEPITETEDLGDGVIRTTYVDINQSTEHPWVRESRLDRRGRADGPHLGYERGRGDYIEGNYKNGRKHGEFRYYKGGNPPDQMDGDLYKVRIYHYGKYISTEDLNEPRSLRAESRQSSGSTASTNIEEQIRSNWPWFIYDMERAGISEQLLAAFTNEVEAKILEKAPTDIDQFVEDYYKTLDEVGSKTQYSHLRSQYIYLGSIYRTDELRHFELRLAVFDMYLGRGSNLFKIVESDYPAFLQALRDKNLTTGTIKGYLDELENNLRKMGPVDLNDALYPFAIEENIEEAADQIDDYNNMKRALRDLMHEMQREGDPLLQGAIASYQAKMSDKVTGVSLTASPSGTSSPGQPVTFTAQATGGVSPHYEFYYRQLPGGKWMRAQSYSTKNTLEAAPNIRGEYEIGVLARSAASKAAYEAQAKIKHLFTTSPVQSVTLTANPPSPTTPGQQITFTALATGGNNPEYRFFYRSYPGGSWIPAGSYSTSNTFTGTSSVTGDYEIGVLARSAGSPVSSEAQDRIIHNIAWETVDPDPEPDPEPDPDPAYFEATSIVTNPAPAGSVSITPYGFFDYIYPGPFTVTYTVTNTGELAGTQNLTSNAFVSFDFGETGHLIGGHVVESITIQPGQSLTKTRSFNAEQGDLWTFYLSTGDDQKEYKLLVDEPLILGN